MARRQENPEASSAVRDGTYDASGQNVAESGTHSAQWRRRESNAILDCGNELEHNELSVDEPVNSVNAACIVGPSGHELSLAADTSLLRLIKVWWSLPRDVQNAIVTVADAANLASRFLH